MLVLAPLVSMMGLQNAAKKTLVSKHTEAYAHIHERGSEIAAVWTDLSTLYLDGQSKCSFRLMVAVTAPDRDLATQMRDPGRAENTAGCFWPGPKHAP